MTFTLPLSVAAVCLLLPGQGPPQKIDPLQGTDPIQDLTEVPREMSDAPLPEWTLLNRVEVIVNEDIITYRDLLNEIRLLQARGAINTEADMRAAESKVLRERIRNLLEVQAGQDLGLPREVLVQQVESVMKREVEEAGGVTAMAEQLKRRQTDSSDRREAWTERLYSITWNRIVTGEQPGASGRPTQDRYVRPGMRLFVHRTVLETPWEYSRFGGVSPAASFRLLMIDYLSHGGRAEAREDFEMLVDAHGVLKGDRAVIRTEVERLRSLEPEIATFLEDAKPGDTSKVLTAHLLGPDGRPIPAWGVARMIEEVEAAAPDFNELGVQLKLHEFAEETFDARRIENALAELFHWAFVWPPQYADR
jgi:hypothetical protein